MANLYDFIESTKIKAPAQNGGWMEIDFNGESGISTNHGPKLQNAFYKVKHKAWDGYSEYTFDYEESFEKRYETQDDFYPIIALALDLDNTYAGAVMQIGNSFWNGSAFYPGNANKGLNDYWATFKINDSDGYFTAESYEISEGNDGANLTKEGDWDEIAITYNNQTLQTILSGTSGNLLLPPVMGESMSYTWIWNLFTGNAHYTENAPEMNEVDTNIPVLVWDYDYYQDNSTVINGLMQLYLTDGDLSRFQSYIDNNKAMLTNKYRTPSVTEGTKMFDICCDIYSGKWDIDSVEDETYISSRYMQIWIAPNNTYSKPFFALYKAPVSRELRAAYILHGDVKQVRYSTDKGNSWTIRTDGTIPFDYFYYKRTNELGRLTYDKNHSGNILLYDSEALANEASPYMAADYDEKSMYYTSGNSTGTAESSTTMNTTYLKSFFQRRYICDKADINTIANALFDTGSGGLWDDIKQGLEMFNSPIDVVAGLTFFGFDLTTVFDNLGTAASIWFGGYQFTGVSVKELINYNGYKEIGSIEIKTSFPDLEDVRNYEPYFKMNIWLPYIGFKQLSANKYIGKTLSVRYYVDVHTGGCMAVLFADGLMTDEFSGTCGVQLPITLTDYAAYAAAQIRNITEVGTAVMNTLSAGASGDVGSSLKGLAEYDMSMQDLKHTTKDSFNTTKGASTAMLNQYLPNYVFVVFEITETEITPNLLELDGRATNASGSLGSFNGFLQIADIKLQSSKAMSEAEKKEFISQLEKGIYI